MEDKSGDHAASSNSKKKKLLTTGLINISFICLGIADSVFGPTLLDIKDIYQTKIKVISLVVLLRAIGSVIGASLVGILLDKYPKFRYFFLFGSNFVLGVCTSVLPHLKYLWLFFAVSVVSSFSSGSLDTGGNVLCLDVWKDGDAGPYMHSIHFSFAIGAFLAPVIAIPFLDKVPETELLKETLNETLEAHGDDSVETKITYLYPLIGICVVLCSLGYLIFGITEQKVYKKSEKSNKDIKNENENPKLTKYQWALIFLMILFFFFYVGCEVTFGLYLATFAVESNLKLTKQVGAQITALFWGTFASMRFVSIFAAIYLKPIYIMFFSCLLSSIGSVALAIYGDKSEEVLWIGSGLLGIGMASIYATGVLWLKSYLKITNRIGAALSIGSSIGADVFPVIGGQLIEKYPMTFMYLTAITMVSCSVMFLLAIFIGNKIVVIDENKDVKNVVENVELMAK